MKIPSMKRAAVACGALAALFATAANAEINAQCLDKWQQAITTAGVGQKCKYMDAAATAKLKNAEDGNLQCAGAKASPEERKELAANAEKTKGFMSKNMADMPCGPDAKKFYDAQLGQIK